MIRTINLEKAYFKQEFFFKKGGGGVNIHTHIQRSFFLQLLQSLTNPNDIILKNLLW